MQIILTEEEFNALKNAEALALARVKVESDKRIDKFLSVMLDGLRVHQDHPSFHSPYVTLKHLQERVGAAREACAIPGPKC
jgi:hypothetical protein